MKQYQPHLGTVPQYFWACSGTLHAGNQTLTLQVMSATTAPAPGTAPRSRHALHGLSSFTHHNLQGAKHCPPFSEEETESQTSGVTSLSFQRGKTKLEFKPRPAQLSSKFYFLTSSLHNPAFQSCSRRLTLLKSSLNCKLTHYHRYLDSRCLKK